MAKAQFSHNGAVVATGGYDNLIRFWDAETGVLLHTCAGHTSFIRALSFNSDDTQLVSDSANKTARLWNVASGESQAVLQGHQHAVSTVQFSPDNRLVMTVAADTANNGVPETATNIAERNEKKNATRLWDAETGELHDELDAGAAATSAAFDRDGETVGIGCVDGTVRIWDIASKSLQHAFSERGVRTPKS